MSNRRTNDEYPEHLNPFKRLGLRGSFRELKRNFDIKIRRKEPKKIPNKSQVHSTESAPNQERLNDPEVTLREHGVHQQHKSEIYPRSRFNERANKAQTLAPASGVNPFGEDTTQEQNNNNRNSDNPFNDESSETTKPTEVDGVKPTGKRYRRKKRAPLPPNRLGANTLDLHQSQWSISSYETDCSSTAYNSETIHDEHEHDFNGSMKGLDDIHEISKEIIDYCTSVDENKNVSDNGIDAKPEIVVSDETESREILKDAANGEVSDINNKDENDKNSHNKVALPCANAENPEDCIDKSDEIIAEDKSGEIIGQADNPEHDQNGAINERDNFSQEVAEKCVDADVNQLDVLEEAAENNESVTVDVKIIQQADHNTEVSAAKTIEAEEVEEDQNSNAVCVKNTLEGNDALVETSSECISEEVVLRNDKNEEDECIQTNGNNSFVETKSLYITGSVDNLDAPEVMVYREKTALYITGSRDELNANLTVVEKTETPTPKLRKHKFKESP